MPRTVMGRDFLVYLLAEFLDLFPVFPWFVFAHFQGCAHLVPGVVVVFFFMGAAGRFHVFFSHFRDRADRCVNIPVLQDQQCVFPSFQRIGDMVDIDTVHPQPLTPDTV